MGFIFLCPLIRWTAAGLSMTLDLFRTRIEQQISCRAPFEIFRCNSVDSDGRTTIDRRMMSDNDFLCIAYGISDLASHRIVSHTDAADADD
jgi:hypothetical protein